MPNQVRSQARPMGLLAIFLLAVSTADAAGRIEINQASVESSGGFPHTITSPGSYVLTGALTAPNDTTAILLATSEVVLDLNGFSISGGASCTQGDCPSGLAGGILSLSQTQHGHRTTVRNGVVRGFAGDCIRLGSQARIDDVLVSECGRRGIVVGAGSVSTFVRVSATGEDGIVMNGSDPPSIYAHSTVASSGLGGSTSADVVGGRASAGSSCSDASCVSLPARRYYLTIGVFDGSEAMSACASGYHMASMWEILDPSNLRYDTSLGWTQLDSGLGPPNLTAGWIRTGTPATFGGAGGESCNGYSTTAGNGTAVNLSRAWDAAAASDPDIPAWSAFVSSCSSDRRVWCVED